MVPRLPHIQRFTRRTLRTQNVKSNLLQQKDTKQNQHRGMAHRVRSGGNQAQLPRVLSQKSHAGCEFLQQRVVTTHVKRLPGKLIRDSVPRTFTGGRSHRHPLPSRYQNSRLPEERVVQHKSCCLYKQFRHGEPLHSGNGGNLSKIQIPKPQPWAKADFLRIAAPGL